MEQHSDIPPFTLRNAFFAGLVLVAPLFITIWAFAKIVYMIGGTFAPVFFFFVPPDLRDRPSLTAVWNVLATVITLGLVTSLGYLSHYVFGKFFLELGNRAIQGIPGVNGVYNTVRQIVNTFSTQSRQIFSKVVLIEFPRKGCWTIGFLTNTTRGEAQARTGDEVWSVFVPTTPNPTSGFLLMLPKREVIELDMGVGDGMKMIISGGAVVPEWPAAPGTVRAEPAPGARAGAN